MAKIAIVYHSGYGHTKKLAEAVERGADTMNRVGSFSGAMSQSSTKLGAETAPPAGDLRTGELLGERVARLAARFGGSQ